MLSQTGAAAADTQPPNLHEAHDVAILAVVLALTLFVTLTAFRHMSGRRRWAARELALVQDLNAARAKLDRADVFLAAEPQLVIAWSRTDGDPDIEGDLSLITDAPYARRVLGFGSWLAPAAAQALDSAVDRLRTRGEAFRLPVQSLAGRHLEIDGRAVSGRAVMRVRDVSGDRLETYRLREENAQIAGALRAHRAMLDAAQNPAWLRNGDGKLVWVNAAYVRAVEAKDTDDAVLRGLELLERPARDASAEARAAGIIWTGRAPAVVAGVRRNFTVLDVPVAGRSAGMATDLSDVETLQADLARQIESHAGTLDQLSTAVAIFDRSKRLLFHNAAYRQLWSLDLAFFEQNPSDSEILDRLRAARLLPEQADFRSWKAGLFAAYQSVETVAQVWHLPDGRTLRVVINPNPQGGVTYLFDDVTERFHLESKFNEAVRVQGETLDTLKEGVVVFGTDGRMKLLNSAFARLWGLDAALLTERPHVDRVARLCASLCSDPTEWNDLRAAVAGLHDARMGLERRLLRSDGVVIDCATAPLPDGATLLTFTDTTASANVERALTERNQALVEAEKLRNDFVHHVSYELRSPLTNIIGFTQLLGTDAVGPLNDRQREYAGYVVKSSTALLAIINDILDLASIDTDAMELSLGEVDIARTMRAASEGVQDRLAESDITLKVVALDDVGSFVADGKRIRQILFNLLSNAIGFSSPGQTVTLAALRRPDEVVFKITDQGRGIPHDVMEHVFDRFHSHTIGSRHRGVGLGLSIVRSFVELHRGRVLIDSAPGLGTTVTCILPTQDASLKQAERA